MAKKRIASLYRNDSDTVRVHIYDRAIYGSSPRGQEFSADIFFRYGKWRFDAERSTFVKKTDKQVELESYGLVLPAEDGDHFDPAEVLADSFYSKAEALEWVEAIFATKLKPMRLPAGADSFTHGW